MNKNELVNAVALKYGLSKTETGNILNAVLDAIAASLADGHDVSLPGFGVFTVKTRSARIGRNLLTGGEFVIGASRVPAFRPGKNLKDGVNK